MIELSKETLENILQVVAYLEEVGDRKQEYVELHLLKAILALYGMVKAE